MQQLNLQESLHLINYNTTLKPPVFILGCGRSGTTLLRNILGRSHNIYAIQGETHLFSMESNPYAEYLSAFKAENDIENLTLTIICSIIFGHECTAIFSREKKFPKEVHETFNKIKEFLNIESHKDPYSIFDLCAKFFTLKENKKRWVEKTPNNIFKITHILSFYPNAKFIHIYRDPRAVYYSWKTAKQDFFQGSNIYECLYRWNSTSAIAENFLQNLPDQFYNLSYENLITNQEEELKKLCAFLEEDFNYSMLKETIQSKLDTWKSKLSSYELILIDIKTKKYRKKLNYPDSNKKLTILNIPGFIPFLITKQIKGSALVSIVNRIFGKLSVLISKNIILSYEITASIHKKNYGLKDSIKTVFRCISRKQKIKKYFEKYPIRKLQIGTSSSLIPGWLNTCLNPYSSEVIFLDATRRFPFENETLDYIFSKHFIEHLSLNRASFMLNECYRVLKQGGKIRIATPNLEVLIELYKTRDKSKLFNNLGHKFIYDKDTLKQLLEQAGFKKIQLFLPGESEDEKLKNLEHGISTNEGKEINMFETMVMEGTKQHS